MPETVELHAGGELLTLGEAALLAGCHPATLFAAATRGDLTLQRQGRRWVVRRWEIEALAARGGAG